jgi:hypothetical protein
MSDALAVNGIPRTLLLKANGTVVFDLVDFAKNELHNEIAKLGPQYATLAPKSLSVSCADSK